jgi:signal transduction histidine kinase
LRAFLRVDAPWQVTLLVLLGIPLLGALTFFTVLDLQMDVKEEQGRAAECAWCDAALSQTAGTLERLAERLTTLAQANTRITEFWLLRPDRRVVKHFLRSGRTSIGTYCPKNAPLKERQAMEHAAGHPHRNPHGCLVLPIRAGGELKAALVVHTERDWSRTGTQLASVIERTAWRLIPPFAAIYLLLGSLLVLASRKARRWRERAAVTERVEALGALADGINHEIRNPLNTVVLSFQYLERSQKDEETRKVVRAARDQADRIRATLDEFVNFTRLTHLNLRDTSVGAALRQAAETAEEAASERDIRIRIEGDARTRADSEKLADALATIVRFLVDHAGPGSEVDLRVEETRHCWQFRARANAAQLNRSGVVRLFDPYLRPKPGDVGRGLALARAVFQVHGGDLEAQLEGDVLVLRGRAPKTPGEAS